MREELAESAELRAEFDELDDLLGRVRETMPVEDVSPGIHASIMDAARLATEQAGDDRVARRQPPEATGFWRRVSRGQGSQFALVAAVLVAGLFVVRFLENGDHAPTMARADDLSAMTEAAPPAALPREQSKEAAADGEAPPPPVVGDDGAKGAGESAEAIADQWSPKPDAEEKAAAATPPEEVEKSLRAELDRSPEPAKDTPGRGTSSTRTRQHRTKKSANKPSRAMPKPQSKPRPTKRPADNTADSAFELPDTRSLSKKAEARDDTRKSDDGLSGKVSSTSTKSGEGFGMPAAEPVQAQDEDKRDYQPPANSISAVNNYYRQGDYLGTIRAADAFLSTNENATPTERASAMYVKAQALEKSGKYNEAARIYEAISKNYPSYNSAAVKNSLEEIRIKTAKKPAPKAKRKADKASSVDMLESEAPEAY